MIKKIVSTVLGWFFGAFSILGNVLKWLGSGLENYLSGIIALASGAAGVAAAWALRIATRGSVGIGMLRLKEQVTAINATDSADVSSFGDFVVSIISNFLYLIDVQSLLIVIIGVASIFFARFCYKLVYELFRAVRG